MPLAPASSRRLAWAAFAVCWLALLFVASPFDLAVSQALHRPGDPWAALVQDHGTRPALLLWVPAIAWLMITPLRRRSLAMSRGASALLTHALLHSLAVTNLLKSCWGRVRFGDLPPDLAGYTPFWLPTGPGDGLSFPSGHVATACTLAPLILLALRARRWGLAAALGLVTLAWALPVGWYRMVYGAHFLTDVLFSVGAAALLAPLSIALGDRYLALFDKE